MLTLGLKQYLDLTVSISNGFGLFQQLNCNLGLHFTPGLQPVFYTDRFVKPFCPGILKDHRAWLLRLKNIMGWRTG